jgi:hypothetical protein
MTRGSNFCTTVEPDALLEYTKQLERSLLEYIVAQSLVTVQE